MPTCSTFRGATYGLLALVVVIVVVVIILLATGNLHFGKKSATPTTQAQCRSYSLAVCPTAANTAGVACEIKAGACTERLTPATLKATCGEYTTQQCPGAQTISGQSCILQAQVCVVNVAPPPPGPIPPGQAGAVQVARWFFDNQTVPVSFRVGALPFAQTMMYEVKGANNIPTITLHQQRYIDARQDIDVAVISTFQPSAGLADTVIQPILRAGTPPSLPIAFIRSTTGNDTGVSANYANPSPTPGRDKMAYVAVESAGVAFQSNFSGAQSGTLNRLT